MSQLHINYDVVMGKPNEPITTLTKLGWVLLGDKTKKDRANASLNHIVTSNVDELVQKFWKVESYGTLPKKDPTLLPKNDAHALQILEPTTTKEKDRYSVRLLWKDDKPILPDNRNMAISRMLSLERKFEKQPSLKCKYVETINEYIEKGHVSKLPHKATKEEQNEIINYIPHQAVTSINKPGKMRVVFDAGAKYGNTSLNEKLYKGPDLLNSLAGTLLHFRQGKYSMIADIEKMFHQFIVQGKDRDALRFLWRSNKGEEFHDLRMNVHVFGKVDSSCCCIWALNKTATDNITNITNRVKDAILDNFYMDDYLDSLDTTEEAIETSGSVITTLKTGAFRLTKWVSND